MELLFNFIVSIVLSGLIMGAVIFIGWKFIKVIFEGIIKIIYLVFYKDNQRNV